MENVFIFSFFTEDKEGIYRDMTTLEGKQLLDFLPSHKVSQSILFNGIKKLALSYKIENTIALSLMRDLFINLENYNYIDDNRYYILMPSSSVAKMSLSYLRRFKKRHTNVMLFPILTDSMHANSPHMMQVRKKLRWEVWDRVLTFDKNDAEEFSFSWFGYSWYSSFDFIQPNSTSCDLFYVGYKKGNREETIADVYQAANKHGVNCNFLVVSDSEEQIKNGSSLHYTTKRYKYPDVVSYIKASNCILEVLQEGQDTQTIKYYEAIVYNKKLLSNYRHLKDLPYYDENTMHYFQNAADIDWEWVKKPETIQYQYKGEYSPLRIIDYIKCLYKENFDNAHS